MHQITIKTMVDCLSSFNIRSFGSWNASRRGVEFQVISRPFQYPLFRIVECINSVHSDYAGCPDVSISALSDRGMHQSTGIAWGVATIVSISALSDRGMHHGFRYRGAVSLCRFNIRSFGSWNASLLAAPAFGPGRMFQYPLFRIVECI